MAKMASDESLRRLGLIEINAHVLLRHNRLRLIGVLMKLP